MFDVCALLDGHQLPCQYFDSLCSFEKSISTETSAVSQNILLGTNLFVDYVMMKKSNVFKGSLSGLNATIVPMYLTEISPTKLRGALGSAGQLLCTFGTFISLIIGLPQVFGTPTLWPLIFGVF